MDEKPDLSLEEETYDGVVDLVSRINDHIDKAKEEDAIENDGECQICGSYHWELLDNRSSFSYVGESRGDDIVYLGPEGAFVVWDHYDGRYRVLDLERGHDRELLFEIIRDSFTLMDKEDLVEVLEAILDEFE